MNLVTRKEAAKAIYMSEGILSYWARDGRLTKHRIPGKTRQYLVNLDEVKELATKSKRELLMKNIPDNLITTLQASKLLYVTDRQICYYAKQGYIKRHYVLGNDVHYLVDREEVLAQESLIEDRLRHADRIDELREQATKMKRDSRGWWIKEDSNG